MPTPRKPDDELRQRRSGSTVRRNLTLTKTTVDKAEKLAAGRSLSLVVDLALAEWVERQGAIGEDDTEPSTS